MMYCSYDMLLFMHLWFSQNTNKLNQFAFVWANDNSSLLHAADAIHFAYEGPRKEVGCVSIILKSLCLSMLRQDLNTNISNGTPVFFYLRNTTIFLKQWNWWQQGKSPYLRLGSTSHWSQGPGNSNSTSSVSVAATSALSHYWHPLKLGSTYSLWLCLTFLLIIWYNCTQHTLFYSANLSQAGIFHDSELHLVCSTFIQYGQT